jgi:hypothetical protein
VPARSGLARLLKSRDIDIARMTPDVARSVGLMCARCGHDDVIDVHVALCARESHHVVVTSDLDHMLRIDPALPVTRALPARHLGRRRASPHALALSGQPVSASRVTNE